MSSTQQNLIALAIILLVLAFIGWIGQKPFPAPAGLVSVNHTVKIALTDQYTKQQVNFFETPPAGAQAVGAITAELAFNSAEQQKQIKEMLDYVRQQAAAAGANSIVVEIFAPRGQVLYFSGRLFKH